MPERITRRDFLKIAGIGGAAVLIAGGCSEPKNKNFYPKTADSQFTPLPTIERSPETNDVQVLDLDGHSKYELPGFTFIDIESLQRPYVGITSISIFANLNNGLLFSVISTDPEHKGHSNWGKDARAGFCLYDEKLDINKAVILGQVDPPKFGDPNDFELDALATVQRTKPNLQFEYLEYQKIPPRDVDLTYLIREGIFTDKNGQPNPRSRLDTRVRFKYSDPAKRS